MPQHGWWTLGAAAIGMAVLAGCGPSQSSEPGPRPQTSTTARAPQASANTPAPQTSKASVPLAKTPVSISTGSHAYTLAVPAASNILLARIDVIREGVLWVTPPGFPDAQDDAMSDWRVWLTPANAPGGSLWQKARPLAAFSGRYSSVSIFYVTKGRALVEPVMKNRSITPTVVDLRSGATRALPTLASNTAWTAGHGVFAWQSAPGKVTVDNLSTAAEATVSVATTTPMVFWAVSGGLQQKDGFIPVSIIPTVPKPELPAGYRWVSVAHSTTPVMAVPDAWTVTEEPGGSSQGVKAVNPQDPEEVAVAWDNACAGCYLPTGASTRVASVNSPAVGGNGIATAWLGEHVMAYTANPGSAISPGSLPTYGLQEATVGGGLDQVSVTLPSVDKGTATTILNSALAVFKSGPLS